MALFRLLEQRCGLFAGCGVGRCAQVVESRFGYPITCFCGRIELLNVKPQQVIEGGTGERMVLKSDEEPTAVPSLGILAL